MLAATVTIGANDAPPQNPPSPPIPSPPNLGFAPAPPPVPGIPTTQTINPMMRPLSDDCDKLATTLMNAAKEIATEGMDLLIPDPTAIDPPTRRNVTIVLHKRLDRCNDKGNKALQGVTVSQFLGYGTKH
jgi:hypothetical protein